MDLSKALEVVSNTDKGMVRSHNEDAVFANAAGGFVVLADGMGGYNAGEVASGMATTLLGSELQRSFAEREPHEAGPDGRPWVHAVLEKEIARANGAIYQAAQSQPQYAGMGTTLVMAVFHNDTITVAHIGDSRLYRLRGDEFGPVTRDHSLLQEQIDSGMITAEQARHSQNRNLVTRALGVDPTVEPEIHDYPVQPGDIYLLCSDGLNDMVEDEEIGMTLQMLSANLELCATQLVQMANDNGGRDNVSVILVRIKESFTAPRRGGWLARLLAWFK
jgi:PPM family protein phosphatase